MPINYKFAGSPVWVHRLHDVTQDRYGLFEGRVTWMTSPDYYQAAIPNKFSNHPLFSWLELERWSTRQQGPWIAVEGEYFGIEGNESEPIYELANSAGEFPIETHPKFKDWLESSQTLRNQIDENGQFLGFPYGELAGGADYEDLFGVEAFLDYGEVVWRKTWNSRKAPTDSDLEAIGKIQDPDGNPPTPEGRDWILISNPYVQRGKTFRRTKEWKLSGPKGANPLIYNYE